MADEKIYNSTDDDDFKAVYMSTARVLLRVSANIVGDAAIAEELVHDSFIKMRGKGMRFASIDDAKFWLIRVVSNLSINYANRKKREKAALEKTVVETPVSESADALLFREDLQNNVRTALAKLGAKLQSAIYLREYADLTYQEIAKMLGISKENVKIRIFRAREQLVKLLGGSDGTVSK